MDRRKFLKLGGILSASTATIGVVAKNEQNKNEQSEMLPEFQNGELLTSESLNAMVRKINELQSNVRNA